MTDWRWVCSDCGCNGPADTYDLMFSLRWFHRFYFCPATAPDRAEFELRLARRAVMTRLYPGQHPAYTRGFREGNSVAI